MKDDNYQLWKEYKEKENKEARRELIKKNLYLVKYQAGRVNMLVPEYVEKEDLESYGIIGLIDAVEKFDHRMGIKFSTYAAKRIKGEIIDQLRKLDWLPSSLRRKEKEIRKKKEELSRKLGRNPDEDELLEELDISREELKKIYLKTSFSGMTPLDKETGGRKLINLIESNEDKPESSYWKKDTIAQLAEAIDRLAKKERLVLALYYYEDLTQVEIAEVMELSPARISQLHKKAIYRLRGILSRRKKQLI